MDGPRTHFERTNELSTLKHEETFFRQLADETSMRLKIVGRSSMGRPILSCSIGNPNGKSLFVVHGQHGSERMGRESAQSFMRNLAYSPTAIESAFLQNYSVVLIPTANPDGTDREPRTRATATKVDMNRSWITMNQPESIAIKRSMNDADPLVLIDVHEHNPQSSNQVSYFFGADEPLVSTPYLNTIGANSQTWMLKHLDDNGITHEPFPSNPSAHHVTLRSHCLTNHIYPMLIETIMRRSESNRLNAALTFLHGALKYMHENIDFIEYNIESSIEESEDGDATMYIHSKNAHGTFRAITAQTDPGSYTIPSGVDIPHGLLQDLGIEINGRVISTQQRARKHIGTLFSPNSYYYYNDYPQPPLMPISGRGRGYIKGAPSHDVRINLAPSFGVD